MINFKTLQAQNFMSFKDLSLNLEAAGITAIEGQNKVNSSFISNGSGKSTILESFVWSIWGETIRSLDSVEDVVNEKMGVDCQAYISFSDNEEVSWEIRRYRAHHEFKNRVLLFREGEEWTKDVKVQDKINAILGIDFKTFKSAFIFYNDGTKPFSACTDSEQKKLLEKLFDLEKYSSLLEITKNKLKNINAQHGELVNNIGLNKSKLDLCTKEIVDLEFKERLFTKDIEEKAHLLDTDISNLEKQDNSTTISNLNQEIDNYKIELEGLSYTDETAGLSEQLEALRKELNDLVIIKTEDPSPIQERLNSYARLSGDYINKIYSKKRDIEDLKKTNIKYEQGIGIQYPTFDVDYALSIKMTQARIKDLCDKKTKFEKGLGVECPNCNQEITSEYKQKHIDEITTLIETNGEDLLRLINDKETLESKYREDNLKLVKEALQTTLIELEELDRLKADSDQKWNEAKHDTQTFELKREEKQNKESSLRGQIDKQATLIDTKKSEKRKKEEILTKQIGVNKDRLNFIEKEQSNNLLKISMLQKQREQIKNTVNLYTDMIESKSQQACELFDVVEKASQEEKEVAKQIKHYQFFENAFSRSGIQSYLLDNIIPVLNKYAKHYADILSGGSLQVEFCNQSTNKSGEVKEKFSVLVTNKEGSKSYSGDSSGEKRRVDLITLFSLQKAAMLRSKSRFSILFLDEIFDSLDPAGIENVINILEDEVQSFPSIFLISHNPEVGGLLDNTITVCKEDGFSSLVSM
jgi:DNA repair exonuclease SbcCD ATPase subunit